MPTLEAIAATQTQPSIPQTAMPQSSIVEQWKFIPASRADVFAAWTNAEQLKAWFGPATMTCTTAQLDARIGGAYKIGVTPNVPDAPEAFATGQYLKVVPNQLLQFNWKPSWRAGELSLVTVSLEDAPGGTDITIRHEGFTAEAAPNYKEGWIACLNKLAAAAERG